MINAARLAHPYARAAFEYAQEHHQLDHWASALKTMAERVQHPQIIAILKNPAYSADTHRDVMLALGQGVLDQAGENFIKTLASNRRLMLLPEIYQEFDQLLAATQQTLRVHVTSAKALTVDEQHKLTTALAQKFGRQITLECAVNPELLGGLLIKAGDRVVDNTIRGQLQRLREVVVQ